MHDDSAKRSSARSHLIDLSPLKESPAFARMWIGSALAGLGGQLTLIAVMLHMFALTGSTFAVSMIAVAGLIPMILAGLYGGVLADSFDRRTVALIAASVTWTSTLLLAVLAWSHLVTPAWLYALMVINSAANSIVMGTRSAIVPRLISRERLPAASALQGITIGIMVMAGPAVGGILVASTDYAWTYTIDVVLMFSLFLGLWTLPKIVPEGAPARAGRAGLGALREGLSYLNRAKNIRTLYLLDLVAMTFGNPIALFPALGTVILGGGEITTGILTASAAVGMFICSMVSGRFGAVRHQTRALEKATYVFAAATSAFGIMLLLASLGLWQPENLGTTSTNVPMLVLGALCLAVAGAADNVTAIFRSTILLAAVPDEMRGRQQGIFIVIVTGGPRLGALYVGTLSTVAALWVPPLLGGILIAGIVAVLLRVAHPGFRAYDAQNPVA